MLTYICARNFCGNKSDSSIQQSIWNYNQKIIIRITFIQDRGYNQTCHLGPQMHMEQELTAYTKKVWVSLYGAQKKHEKTNVLTESICKKELSAN